MSLQNAFDRLNETRQTQAAAAANAVRNRVKAIEMRKEERFRAAFSASVARIATHLEKDLNAIIAQKRESLFVPRPVFMGGPTIDRNAVSYTLFKMRSSDLPEDFSSIAQRDKTLVSQLADICDKNSIDATVRGTWNCHKPFEKNPTIELVVLIEPKPEAPAVETAVEDNPLDAFPPVRIPLSTASNTSFG